MFTKEDYVTYFDQIARVERKMIHSVYDLLSKLSGPEVARVLEKIGDDEVRHYGYVFKIFPLIGGRRELEKRRVSREYCTGAILLRHFQDRTDEGVKAYCVNLSNEGICLECDRALKPGEEWDLEVRLFDKNDAIVRHGKTVWSKEVEPGLYISGIVFNQ